MIAEMFKLFLHTSLVRGKTDHLAGLLLVW